MRAHTITTKARVGARGRPMGSVAPRGILALSLAVVLLAASGGQAAALTGNGVTTPTPSAPPLTLDLRSSFGSAFPHKKLIFHATTSNDSTLVATGRKIKKTTKQLAAGEETKITVRVKHKKQLMAQPGGKAKVKVKFAATDESGQTATDVTTLMIVVHSGGGVIVVKELTRSGS